jgi:hypothetical protein
VNDDIRETAVVVKETTLPAPVLDGLEAKAQT